MLGGNLSRLDGMGDLSYGHCLVWRRERQRLHIEWVQLKLTGTAVVVLYWEVQMEQ